MTKPTAANEIKPVQKKKIRPLKKAPQAPKRFKSSYILFFIHVQEDIKKSLPVGQASAPEVSKRASEMWKSLSAEDRLHWDNEAAKEKQRYLAEKEVYTGPWQVPHRRAKKDPSAPKRNPSAFLLFSLTKRKELKEKNPQLKNTEISRILGELWRQTSDEEKRPFIEQEEVEREKYKERMSAWREKKAKLDKEKKERDAENTAKVIAEKKLMAEKVVSNGPSSDELSFKNVNNDHHQPQRMDSFPPMSTQHQAHRQDLSRSSPQMNHPYGNYYPYEYGQQGWQNQELHPQYNSMPPSSRHHHQGEFHIPPPPPSMSSGNGQEKFGETFDVFQNQPQFGFPDQSQYYEQGQHRQVKLENDDADSPYSYTEEFDPVPIH